MNEFVVKIQVTTIDENGNMHDEFHAISPRLVGTLSSALELVTELTKCVDDHVSDIDVKEAD